MIRIVTPLEIFLLRKRKALYKFTLYLLTYFLTGRWKSRNLRDILRNTPVAWIESATRLLGTPLEVDGRLHLYTQRYFKQNTGTKTKINEVKSPLKRAAGARVSDLEWCALFAGFTVICESFKSIIRCSGYVFKRQASSSSSNWQQDDWWCAVDDKQINTNEKAKVNVQKMALSRRLSVCHYVHCVQKKTASLCLSLFLFAILIITRKPSWCWHTRATQKRWKNSSISKL